MIKLAVVGANAPLEAFYRHAKELGCYIIGIAWEEGAVCKKYCDKFYPISFKEKEKVLDVCRKEKINGITSFSLESALPTVIYVANNMGLVGNGYECLKLTEDKFSQCQAFMTNGVSVPKFFKINKIEEFDKNKIKFPVIVKPVDSGGSQGITKLDNDNDINTAIKNALEFSKTGEVIVEEFITGREFSVESLSFKGNHYNLQITDKVTTGEPHFIEIQHHQPADINESLKTRILNLVNKALDALLIKNSPSHSEVILDSDDNLYMIEVGARMGGGCTTSDLVKLSTGYDMVKGCIDLCTGLFQEPKITVNNFSGVYFYTSLTQGIKEIIKNKNLYPEIVYTEMSEDPLRPATSNADRMGCFIYQSNSAKFIPNKHI